MWILFLLTSFWCKDYSAAKGALYKCLHLVSLCHCFAIHAKDQDEHKGNKMIHNSTKLFSIHYLSVLSKMSLSKSSFSFSSEFKLSSYPAYLSECSYT